MKPKFALVQWIGGGYNATYTAGIPVEWIMDFDVDKFDPKTEPEDHSYIIEWRESKSGRMPKCGWKYYDAKVVRVSHRIKSLENQIQILEGAVSPLRPATVEKKSESPAVTNLESMYDTAEEEEEVESNSTSTSTSKTKTKKRMEKGDKTAAEADHEDERRQKKKKKKQKRKLSDREFNIHQFEDNNIPEPLATSSNFQERHAGTNRDFVYDLSDFIQEDGNVPSTSSATGDTYTGKQTGKGHNKEVGADHEDEGRKKKKKKQSGQTSSNQQVEDDIIPDPLATPSNLGDDQSLKQILLNLCKDIKLVKQVQLDMLRNQNQPAQQQNPPDDQVELGHPGSNVFVNQQQWDTANAQNSYTTMGISLVRALFDEDVLMASNLRGGPSKTNKNAPCRPGLNPAILAAIEEAVRNKFPNFKKGHLGSSINNLMTDFRRKNKDAANKEASNDEHPEG